MSLYWRNSPHVVGAYDGATSGGERNLGSVNNARSYKSQYFFGAQNGRCGFRKPTARKNGSPGLALADCRRRMVSSAILPSGYALSGTSAASKAAPRGSLAALVAFAKSASSR